jgi:hypothetical protein
VTASVKKMKSIKLREIFTLTLTQIVKRAVALLLTFTTKQSEVKIFTTWQHSWRFAVPAITKSTTTLHGPEIKAI